MKHLPKNLGWSVLKNVTSQVFGRLLLSLVRFGIAFLIIRFQGLERFGEYSLLLSLFLIAEWIVDFGMTEVVVREICQNPDRQASITGTLISSKLIQSLLALVLLILILVMGGYPNQVLWAGLVGGLNVLLYGGILVYRAMFRVRLVMEREVLAEMLGVFVMVPLIWLVCAVQGRLEWLVVCLVIGRAATLVALVVMGRAYTLGSPFSGKKIEIWLTVKSGMPLGVVGLLVCVYDAMDLILLSRHHGAHAAGQFSVAMRLLFPTLIVVQAITSTILPLLSSYWKREEQAFRVILSRGINGVLVVGAGLLSIYLCGGKFIVGLMGGDMSETGIVLRVLACAAFLRGVMGVVGQLLIVSGRLQFALWLSFLGVGMKLVLEIWLVPLYSAVGAAAACFLTELISLLPALWLTQWLVGIHIDWRRLPRVGCATASTVAVCLLFGWQDTLAGCLLVVLLYPLLAVGFRAVSMEELKQVFHAGRSPFAENNEINEL